MKQFVLAILFVCVFIPVAFSQVPGNPVDTVPKKKIDTVLKPQVPDKTIDTFNRAKLKEKPGTKETLLPPGGNGIMDQKNPFLAYTGKIIRTIRIKSLGFESDLTDTTVFNNSFTTKIANALHKTTRQKVIGNNLLFAEGDNLNPYVLSDNERFLRSLDFIQDAVIIVQKIKDNTEAVDVLILVKDGFSILPGVGVGGITNFNLELKEENLNGTGNKIAVSGFYDGKRTPRFGSGADFLQRNIKGTFINWGLGYRTYRNAFNSNRNEETSYYLSVTKPFASQYLRWMGSLDVSYNKTINGYLPDTAYFNDFRYRYYIADGWFAYNFGTGHMKYKSLKSVVRKFVAIRAFHTNFLDIPQNKTFEYDGTYSDASGVLASFSIFKQNFFRTSYIYGFGRNEDVPEGFNLSLIGGYTFKKDSLYKKFRTRPYYGFETSSGKYNKKGFYSSYTFRIGGYWYQGKWEDFDLLINGDHFTRLRKINDRWFKRFFISGGITKQFVPVLEQALIIRSMYGLPYFEYGYVSADLRATLKTEAVFYNTKKKFGFGYAPFIFGDGILLKPTKEAFGKSDFYSAIGAGIRVRNENLLFGTLEARVSYFPRILPNMNHFKIKFNTNLRFKYNSSFIRRPDFVSPNALN